MGKKLAVLFILLFVGSIVILPLATVKAQPETIIVPDDYPTLTSAVGNAADGDTILIKSGTYEDSAIYTAKSLTIVGEGSQNTIINLKSHSFEIILDILGHKTPFYDPAINITANDFSLSKLTVTSNGGNIVVTGDKTQITDSSITPVFAAFGDYLDIERNFFCKDSSVNASYSTIRGNTFQNSVNYNGISFDGQYNIITNNAISGSGVYVSTALSYLAHNTITGASGSFFILSGNSNIVDDNTIDHFAYGLSASGSNNTILKNTITDCGEGLLPGANNTLYANQITNNAWGLDTGAIGKDGITIGPNGDGTLSGSLLYDNNFVDNTYQVNTLFSAKSDYFDNEKGGNYWSDYHGTDSNGDGIGDTPYVIDANRSDRYPLMTLFNISNAPNLIPDWAQASAIQLINPQSTYPTGAITLDFVVNKQTVWTGYSLDGQNNITINGNITLSNLSTGAHNLTVYSSDTYYNTGSSTINFTVESIFAGTVSTLSLVTATVVAAIIVITLCLFLFRKHKKTS